MTSSTLVGRLVRARAQGERHARLGAGTSRQAVQEGGERPRARDGDERHGGVAPGAGAELAHDLLRGLERQRMLPADEVLFVLLGGPKAHRAQVAPVRMTKSCLQARAAPPGSVPARLHSALRGKSCVGCRIVADILDGRHWAPDEISRLGRFGRNSLRCRAPNLLCLHRAIGHVPKRAGRLLACLAARKLATQLDRVGLSGSNGRSPHASERVAL